MAKNISIQYPAGTKVVVMRRNSPVEDVIRVAQYSSSLETDKGGKQVEVERMIYGTVGDKLTSLNENQIGLTKEELAAKLFGSSESGN